MQNSNEAEFITLEFPVQPELFFNTEDGGRLGVVRPVYNEIERRSEENYRKFVENPEVDFDYEFMKSTLRLSFALGFEERSGDEDHWDVCHCRIRLSDAAGDLWEAKTLFDSDALIENIEDWRRDGWAGVCEPNTEQWLENSQFRLLLQGVRGYYDDRVFRHLILDDEIYDVVFKYQTPIFDIAFCQEDEDACFLAPCLIVRVANFSARGAKELPAFYYAMNCETLMFYANTQGLPPPLVFKKVGAGAPRQAMICQLPNS